MLKSVTIRCQGCTATFSGPNLNRIEAIAEKHAAYRHHGEAEFTVEKRVRVSSHG